MNFFDFTFFVIIQLNDKFKLRLLYITHISYKVTSYGCSFNHLHVVNCNEHMLLKQTYFAGIRVSLLSSFHVSSNILISLFIFFVKHSSSNSSSISEERPFDFFLIIIIRSFTLSVKKYFDFVQIIIIFIFFSCRLIFFLGSIIV